MKAVSSSFLSRLCLTEVALLSVSPPMDQQLLFLFLLLVVTCSHFWVPREMSPLLWCCPFLGEICSVLLCYGCDYCLWIHTWTHSLHLFTPGKSYSDFQFNFTFFHLRTVSWIFCSFVLSTGHVRLFLWLERPLTEARGCLCTPPSGISSDAHCERASQAWGELTLGPRVHPCLCALHFEQQPSEHTTHVSSSVCCHLSYAARASCPFPPGKFWSMTEKS